MCHKLAGRADTGIDIMEQVFAKLPSYGTGVQALILAYLAAGRTEDARRMARELRRIVPDVTLSDTLESSPYRQPDQRKLMIDAFRGVGLPD
jgi:hypothetical protein